MVAIQIASALHFSDQLPVATTTWPRRDTTSGELLCGDMPVSRPPCCSPSPPPCTPCQPAALQAHIVHGQPVKMVGRDGGKAKPLKQKKPGEKNLSEVRDAATRLGRGWWWAPWVDERGLLSFALVNVLALCHGPGVVRWWDRILWAPRAHVGCPVSNVRLEWWYSFGLGGGGSVVCESR